MPTRFDVAVPRTYATAHGGDRTGYTRAGVAYAPDDRDRIDVVLDPGIAIGARTIVMPARPGDDTLPAGERATPRPPPPAHLKGDRYVVCLPRDYDKDGAPATAFNRVGALFRNRAGSGFTLVPNAGIALSGRLLCFPAQPRDDRRAGATAADSGDGPFTEDLPETP